ncbi:ferrochelatase [Schaalia suimastitidis]|uniref:ferrochelatase n=1 Tax=Schaalia suimastitidis TaxID=121163 RepID=UPI0004220435|nr:ferrochelatase [Schaalia suimastitidis]
MTDRDTVSDKAARPVVLLVNLGTPEAPTAPAVRRFLREFLGDQRVVEMHPTLWKIILETFVLPLRPRMVAPQYAKIWTEHGSPLAHWTHMQGQILRERLKDCADVRVAMRYGEPSIGTVLDELHCAGHRRILVLPAYPQYSASTVGTVMDEVARHLLRTRDQLEIRTIRSFEVAKEYIEALAHALETHWQTVGHPQFDKRDRVLLSFHSIPVAMREAGDPYQQHCEATVKHVARRLNLPDDALMVTYQSVFGRAEWIGPATIDTVGHLGRSGTRRVDIICPGFMADCLETLEEINQLNRETFIEAGGESFHYIPWGNDSKGAMSTLEAQARRHLGGWI